jgi:hypothetical protein
MLHYINADPDPDQGGGGGVKVKRIILYFT